MNARVQQLFHDVVDLSPDARVRYFVEHGVDEETRRQVEGLLVFDAVPTTPLERDIGMVASRTLAQLEAISGRCGSYQLLRLIGRGGMGVVYVAQRNDGEVSQQAAVKLLRFGVDSHQARQRFLRERQILANLSHPNIARLLDAGHREDGQPYLVMEYIDGKPIDDYCESLPVRRKVELLVPICEAVSYAHHHLVVHRDLKPGNVLVSPDGIPRLLDFGIAKLMDATGDATVTADRQLTPIYASPEQVRGESVGPATDIYSLGAILFKLLTGRGPFQLASEMTRAELEAAICKTQLIKPSRIQPKVDRDLDAIVLKAMRKEPSERYATVEQLAGDLKAWLQQRPVAARKGERWYLAKRYIRTRWVPLAAAGLALAGLVAGLVLARHQRPRVPEHFEFIRTTRLTSSGQSMKAAISPNGRYIAHTLLTPGMESLQVRQAANLHDVELVPPTAVRYLGITFSPDSETVYYVARAAGTSQPPVLYRVPARGGSPQKLLQGLDSPPTFSPDGKRLAFVRESAGESTLMVVDIDSGAEQRLVSRKLPLVLDYPAWSPDGRIIACTMLDSSMVSARGSDARIIGVHVQERTDRFLSPQTWGFIRQLAWLGDGSGLIMSARGQESGFSHVWFVSYPDGAGRKVTDGINRQVGASVSADSHQMVTVEESAISSIWRMRLRSSQHPESVVAGTNGTSPPLWTPDGRIVFEQELNDHRSIWIVDAAGGHARQFALPGNNYNPSVSADGRILAYVSDRSGSPAVWTMDIDGGSPVMVAAAWPESVPQLSPDGQWIFYTAIGAGQWPTLWRAASSGGRVSELSDKLWFQPAISPDGNWIAGFYADNQLSTEAQPASIAVMRADGRQVRKIITIPSSVAISAGLRWSPDSRELTYVDTRKDGDNIWSLPVTGGAPHQLTHLQGDTLFGFDWSKDGKQVVFSRGVQARDVVLIQDAKAN